MLQTAQVKDLAKLGSLAKSRRVTTRSAMSPEWMRFTSVWTARRVDMASTNMSERQPSISRIFLRQSRLKDNLRCVLVSLKYRDEASNQDPDSTECCHKISPSP